MGSQKKYYSGDIFQGFEELKISSVGSSGGRGAQRGGYTGPGDHADKGDQRQRGW